MISGSVGVYLTSSPSGDIDIPTITMKIRFRYTPETIITDAATIHGMDWRVFGCNMMINGIRDASRISPYSENANGPCRMKLIPTKCSGFCEYGHSTVISSLNRKNTSTGIAIVKASLIRNTCSGPDFKLVNFGIIRAKSINSASDEVMADDTNKGPIIALDHDGLDFASPNTNPVTVCSPIAAGSEMTAIGYMNLFPLPNITHRSTMVSVVYPPSTMKSKNIIELKFGLMKKR